MQTERQDKAAIAIFLMAHANDLVHGATINDCYEADGVTGIFVALDGDELGEVSRQTLDALIRFDVVEECEADLTYTSYKLTDLADANLGLLIIEGAQSGAFA